MSTVAVLNIEGKEVGQRVLLDSVFAIEPNLPVLHMCVVNHLANCRQGTQSTLTRTEVRGGGRKPWRQKGTGHARQGSTRSPQWVHGGVALGPKPRSYRFSLNKKVKKLAMKSALSSARSPTAPGRAATASRMTMTKPENPLTRLPKRLKPMIK